MESQIENSWMTAYVYNAGYAQVYYSWSASMIASTKGLVNSHSPSTVTERVVGTIPAGKTNGIGQSSSPDSVPDIDIQLLQVEKNYRLGISMESTACSPDLRRRPSAIGTPYASPTLGTTGAITTQVLEDTLSLGPSPLTQP